MSTVVTSQSRSTKDLVRNAVKSLLNVHLPNGEPNVVLFTMPRSGSTWLMELIGDQPGFKTCSEPLNLRLPLVRRHLGMADWAELHDEAAGPRIEAYLRRFCEGHLHFLDPLPLRGLPYSFRSSRIVFKILHGAEERIHSVRDALNGRVAYLLRHPIAVSLSHEELPRLHAYVDSAYARFFTRDQLRFARDVIDRGSRLDRGVLAWCFEHSVPLRHRSSTWAVATYEQMVLEPRPVLDHLADRLELPDPDRMRARLAVPSAVVRKSDSHTQRLLDRADTMARSTLTTKWRSQVSEAATRTAMDMLPRFGITAYAGDDPMPSEEFWI